MDADKARELTKQAVTTNRVGSLIQVINKLIESAANNGDSTIETKIEKGLNLEDQTLLKHHYEGQGFTAWFNHFDSLTFVVLW